MHHRQTLRRTSLLSIAAVAASGLLLAGCTENKSAASASGAAGPRTLAVAATDTGCQLPVASAPAGTLTFTVTNSGSKVNEFYLYAADGLTILGEVENIGPGLARELTLSVPAGSYQAACKPGMVGEGIKVPLTVTPSDEPVGHTGDDLVLADQATAQYAAYVGDQVGQLVTKTEKFAALVKAGSDAEARALYPDARLHWERIEPVVESFSDLDGRLDSREADLAPGEEFTGWHRLEKDLWPARVENYTKLTAAQRATVADALVADTHELATRIKTVTFTADGISNGAMTLLDEVATGKVTGEEEFFSRTDLWDFQGNLDGARVAWNGLRPLLQKKNAALDTTLATRFDAVQKLLDRHKAGSGFVTYDKLTPAQVKELSDAVNALAEPLSKMTVAVVS